MDFEQDKNVQDGLPAENIMFRNGESGENDD